MTKPKAIFNWSGGKDSSLALYNILKSGEYEVSYLLTSLSKKYNRISQHGVRLKLLEMQAENLGIPLRKLILPEATNMENYDVLIKKILLKFKAQGISTSIYGDIFLEDLRKYRESRLKEIGFTAAFPLWKINTLKLAREFITLGFKAIIVCVDEKHLDKSFAGREFNQSFLDDLPKKVDPCGEYGEFHSFVYDGPLFNKPVPFVKGQVVHKTYAPVAKGKDCFTAENLPPPKTGFWYCDLLPK